MPGRSFTVNPLGQWPLAAIRRNHALEHAVIHVLSATDPGLSLAGRSDWAGFTLYGPVETERVAEAVDLALRRLQAGERELAIHPRCGTNLATGMMLAGMASQAALSGHKRSRWSKALTLMLGLWAALVLTKPVGNRLQANVTTSMDVGKLRILFIQLQAHGRWMAHRVQTTQA